MISIPSVSADLQKVKKSSPLVHNITNFVVMNNTANALLALGASPVMAHAVEEMPDMAGIASALVLNIGTLSEAWIKAMKIAGKTASSRGIPIVLDPVGAGATPYRTRTCLELIQECSPTIIRGNASEIMTLVDAGTQTKGVDSTESSKNALESAKSLARETGAVVSISGREDYITNGQEVVVIKNHIPLMPRVTGMGCTASALTGAVAAVNPNPLEAAAHAMALMAVAGETASGRANGPGSFQMHFLDALYDLSASDVKKHLLL